jgi:hypothetical protein
MFHKITDIQGIGTEFLQKLQNAGVTTTEQLLDKARDPRGRSQLSGTTAINEPLLTKWVAIADLMRIKGVSQPYCELLIASDVDSTQKLLTFVPKDLVFKMEEQNKMLKLTPTVPTVANVEQWQNELRTPEFALVK